MIHPAIKIITPIVVIGALAAGIFYVQKPTGPDAAPIDTNLPTPPASSSAPAQATTPVPSVLPTPTSAELPSIPALSNYSLTGKDLKVGQVLATTSTYTRYYVTYKSDDLTISGIMNVPKGSGPFPVLMLNHGYIDPAIYTNGRGLKREQDYFASRGYIVFHSDYRNHAASTKDTKTEAQFRFGYAIDVMNAIEALRQSDLPYIDKNNIGMLGHSMGGGVTLQIITAKPDLVKAAVLFAPVSSDVRDNFERWTKTRPEVVKEIIEKYGEPEKNPAFWNALSPASYIQNIKVPVMIHHGTNDESVPLEWSQKLDDALKKASKQKQFFIYGGQPHEFTTVWPTVMKRSIDFFAEHLKNT